MTHDGIAFFGYSDHKLPRLFGAEPSYWDKYKSPRSVIMSLIGLVVGTYVILSQVLKYGKLKTQETSLRVANQYTFNISEQFGIVGITYFYVDELIE